MPNDVTRIQFKSSLLVLSHNDGTTDIFTQAQEGVWIPTVATTYGVVLVRWVGGELLSQRRDGTTFFYNAGSENYLPTDVAAPIDPPPPGTSGLGDDLVNWMVAHIGTYAYSQGSGRLTPDTSGYSDCSALVWYCYKMVTGSESAIPLVGSPPNTYTGTQISQGTSVIATTTANSVDESIMQLGDLVFFDWGSNGTTWSFDHVEMYMGGGQTIGHGGGMGPKIKSLQNNVAYAIRVQVRRYL